MTPQGARTSTLDKLLYRNRLCQRATRTAARGQQAVLEALALDITAATTTRSCLVLAPHPDDETLGAGASLCLAKPFQPESLARRVRELLEAQ